MMTDLASPLFAPAAAPGVIAQVATMTATIGLIALGTGPGAEMISLDPAVALAGPPINPAMITATAFQAALASQVQGQTPMKPVPPASLAIATLAPDTAIPSDTAVALPSPTAQAPRLALAPGSVRQLTTPSPSLALSAPMPGGITLPEMPAPAAPEIDSPASEPATGTSPTAAVPTGQPATISTTPDANGKLPKAGNPLPVEPASTKSGVPPRPGGADTKGHASDDPTDDDSASTLTATDPSVPPLLALLTIAQPVPPVKIERATVSSTQPSRAAAPIGVSTVPPRPVVETGSLSLIELGTVTPATLSTSVPAAALAAATARPAPLSASGVTQTAPATAVMPLPIIIAVPAMALAQIAPVATNQSAPGPVTSGAAVTMQPAVEAPAPALVNLVAASLPQSVTALASPAQIGQSTASRLARQPGASRAATVAAPIDDSAAALPAIFNALPVQNPAATTTSTNSPVATPPDFAALVDRLLEARATAQSSAPPQQISTSVTHADFGKVSLTFQQDPAGLSVSMTSADPAFARAAQSAIVSGQAEAGRAVTADRLMSVASDSQGLTQPNAPAPVASAATDQSGGFSTTSGGSQQSQAQAQPQQRPGFVAANRVPAGSGVGAGGSATGAAATGAGIFA